MKVVLDIIENELSYSQAARKYDMYLSSGSLNDTLPARWVYQYRLYGKERFFQSPKDFSHFMYLCDEAKEKNGNFFSYTLLEERDFN